MSIQQCSDDDLVENRHQTAGCYPPLLAGPRRPNNLAELICDHFSFISPAEKTRGKTGASQLDVGCTAPVVASLLLLYILGKLGGFIIQHVLLYNVLTTSTSSKIAINTSDFSYYENQRKGLLLHLPSSLTSQVLPI